MKKIFLIFLPCFISTLTFSQAQRKATTYLLTQFNNTIYDRTRGNNPWSIGLGIQTFFNNGTPFKPTLELTGDIYLEDDKVLRLNPDGTTPTTMNDVREMINLFGGASFHPTQNIYFSLMAGPSFISGNTYLGVKPSCGFYFSRNQKWIGKISYINIFNRHKATKEDFGSVSLAIGVKLF